jgi:hypothetical protein
VPNPYFINNFAVAATTDPVLYQRLASNPTFSSATIQRQRLLRPFGALTNLTYSNLPLGESKAHSLEVQVNRRCSNGLTGFLSFNANSVRYQPDRRRVRARADALAGQQRRAPWRLAGAASYELPFGRGKRFLSDGGVAARSRATGRSPAPGSTSRARSSTGAAEHLLLRRPRRHRRRRADARSLVQHRRRVRARSGEDARGVPEARVPVPHRRRAQHAADVHEPVDPAQLRRRRRPHVQVRFDAQNIFNRQQWHGPTLNPTSTQFGQVTTVALNQMRFFLRRAARLVEGLPRIPAPRAVPLVPAHSLTLVREASRSISLGRAQTMKKILVVIAALSALGARPAWAPAPGECVPSALNIAEAKYPCLYSDNRALFRVVAPDAQKVRLRMGPGFDMTKGPDGIWTVTTTRSSSASITTRCRSTAPWSPIPRRTPTSDRAGRTARSKCPLPTPRSTSTRKYPTVA